MSSRPDLSQVREHSSEHMYKDYDVHNGCDESDDKNNYGGFAIPREVESAAAMRADLGALRNKFATVEAVHEIGMRFAVCAGLRGNSHNRTPLLGDILSGLESLATYLCLRRLYENVCDAPDPSPQGRRARGDSRSPEAKVRREALLKHRIEIERGLCLDDVSEVNHRLRFGVGASFCWNRNSLYLVFLVDDWTCVEDPKYLCSRGPEYGGPALVNSFAMRSEEGPRSPATHN